MRHRNPMITGALAGAVLFALVAAAVIAPKLVFLTRTNDYTAGLTAHNQVHVTDPSNRIYHGHPPVESSSTSITPLAIHDSTPDLSVGPHSAVCR